MAGQIKLHFVLLHTNGIYTTETSNTNANTNTNATNKNMQV